MRLDACTPISEEWQRQAYGLMLYTSSPIVKLNERRMLLIGHSIGGCSPIRAQTWWTIRRPCWREEALTINRLANFS